MSLESCIVSRDRGVAAVFEHHGQWYGVALPSEDSTKFEVVVDRALQPVESAYLREKTLGAVGGKVEAGESPELALQREVMSELAELLQVNETELNQRLWSQLLWAPLQPCTEFSVAQFKQCAEGGENVPRGWFEVMATVILLTDAVFVELQPVLQALTPQQSQTFRPFLNALCQQLSKQVAE